MLERQRLCGIPADDDARTLVLPVKFNDGEFFPAFATRLKYEDLSAHNYPMPVFAESTKYLAFKDKVEGFARTIVGRLVGVPPWTSDWPLVDVAEEELMRGTPFPPPRL